jgi:hypothetical protein
MSESEAVLAGLAAGSHLAAGAPTASEAAAFLQDVESARAAAFTTAHRRGSRPLPRVGVLSGG